jgi:hypothetical protein
MVEVRSKGIRTKPICVAQFVLEKHFRRTQPQQLPKAGLLNEKRTWNRTEKLAYANHVGDMRMIDILEIYGSGR